MQKDLRARLLEDNTRDRLFHPHMRSLGYPSAAQMGATQYDQQVSVSTGKFDGCYLADGRPMVLVELKREGLLENATELGKARRQVRGYALADEFEVPPPYLLLSDGRVFEMYERSKLDPTKPEYQLLGGVLRWEDAKQDTPGKYAARIVSLHDLIKLFRDFVARIEEEIKPQVLRLLEAKQTGADHLKLSQRSFGSREINIIGDLLAKKKAASTADEDAARSRDAVNEVTAAASLNYVNKVFFLKYCEDRHLKGLFRIIAEIELNPVASQHHAAYAALFTSILKRRASGRHLWTDSLEAEYRNLILDIKHGILDQKAWFEIVQSAFVAAEQTFPVIYRPTPYDYLCPSDETTVEMLLALRSKDFSTLDHEMVGEIYQSILRNEQYRQKVLGAFYTPPKTVAYMVSRLPLERRQMTLEPACGSGHFVEELFKAYARLWQEAGYSHEEAAPTIIGDCLFAFDIDDFAAQLAAMRLFFLFDAPVDVVPNIFVRDTLDINVAAGQQSYAVTQGHLIFSGFDAIDPRAKLSHADELDQVQFDNIVGNPPYGGKPTADRLAAYTEIYRTAPGLYGMPLGSNDTFGFFVANAIGRAREGATICLLVSDSMLSIDTHTELRELILSTCLIQEIVLAPVDLFHPVATARTCIITLRKASGDGKERERTEHRMRLVDRLSSEDEYEDPPPARAETRRQSDYCRVPRHPFFIRVHDDVLALFDRATQNLGDIVAGGAGLQTGNNQKYLAVLEDSAIGREIASKNAERKAANKDPLKRTYPLIAPRDLAMLPTEGPYPVDDGFPDDSPHYVPFVHGSSRHPYVAPVERYVDYSQTAVKHYKSSSSAVARNRRYYFQRGVTTNAHNRVLRAALADKAIPAVNTNLFVPSGCSVEYLLGLLNSRLTTYICTKILNSSIGGLSAHLTPQDIRLVPYVRPDAKQQAVVEKAVQRILSARQADLSTDILLWQEQIDNAVFAVYGLSGKAVEAVNEYWDEVSRETAQQGDSSDAP